MVICQDIGYIFFFVLDIKNVLLKTITSAGFAGKENIGHKLHLYLNLTLALANIATATLNVK
jgi:hypothetical protein